MIKLWNERGNFAPQEQTRARRYSQKKDICVMKLSLLELKTFNV